MKGSVIAVSGIDTGTGKTVATGLLGRAMLDCGVQVITQKLVQTGCAGRVAEDIFEHRRIMGIGLMAEDLDGLTSPYVFPYPASPHLAAKLGKQIIDLAALRRATFRLQQSYGTVLLEGAGGLLVPLDGDQLLADYIRDAGYPLLLVTSSRLGSINHTLLSIEACLTRGISIKGILFNRFREVDRLIGDDSLDMIRHFLKRYGISAPLATMDEHGLQAGAASLFGLVPGGRAADN
ncbi:MAG: ATP-dependent dethiobiotin synthetase BioD [Chlorobiaceae bacterium]|jgi:dethiobiotin synthetase|nr:ATP-dependent dethiobiotin synthetase BioD [Chlorobiaceae bacterium]